MPLFNNPTSDDAEQTSSAQDSVDSQNEKPGAAAARDPKTKKLHDDFRSRVDICKLYRRKLIANWTINIDYRRGKPFSSQTDEDQVSVNLDWTLTKSKQAALFSQVPQVRIDHVPDTLPQAAPWAMTFERKLNDTLLEAGVEAALDECLPDCINAAGMGVVMISYETLQEDRQVPKQDLSLLPPEVHSQVLQSGQFNGEDLEMETVPHIKDHRYCIERISPADLLWPINYTGSNFEKAPWIGRSGRMTWATAVQRYNLQESDKEKVLGEDRPMLDKLTHDVERDKVAADDMVPFDEIFYREAEYNEDPDNYTQIHHLVFIGGKDEPVLDEPWKGQRLDEELGKILGAQSYPIKVLTLTYITDESIPPSDSAIGRPQVNEINKARTQMIRQRERSLPVRWFDVNFIDPTIQQSLMRGTWQAMIPVQGDGSRRIGEVARAQMPVENFKFDEIAKRDLHEEWVIAEGQAVNSAKGDPDQNHANFNTQVGRERAKVGSFFVCIAEVLGGLMCLYEDPQSFGPGFNAGFSTVLSCSIIPDSTILLDANQKLERLDNFINKYAKSGWINIEPVLQEIAVLTGLDPSIVVRAPQPKPPVEPNISLRLTGVEDMLNPLTLAFLIKSGQAPPPELIEQAKQLIQQAVVPPQPPPPQMGPDGQPLPPQQPGKPLSPGLPGGPMPHPAPGVPPGSPTPNPPPPKMGESHPQWSGMPQVNKRTESGGKQ
jgi:hypothetical protein